MESPWGFKDAGFNQGAIVKMQHGTGAFLSFLFSIVTSTVLANGPGPTISEQPTNDSVIVGGAAMFSVTATGTLPINYFWSFNNANIPGATNSTLTLTKVMPSQAGIYSVFIMNSYGSTNSATAILTVFVPPFITNQPVNQTVSAGGTAKFSVGAGGTQPLSYEWNFDGTNITGATGATLTLTNVHPSQSGSYAVTVSNPYGSTNSASVTLTVVSPTTNQFFDDFKGPALNPVWQTNMPGAVSGALGTGTEGDAAYIGAPNYTFGLLDSNTVLNMHSVMGPFQRAGWSSSTVFQGTNFRYEARFNTGFLSATTSMDGFLEIWIMNATNDDLYFMVSTYEGESDTYVFFGTSVYGLFGASPYTFEDNTWYRLALQCLPGQFIHASLCDDNERELFGTDIATADGSVFGSGYNIVIAQNVGTETNLPASAALDYVSLTSQFSPAIIDQPKNQTVAAGTNATIGVTAEGPPPLGYQWTFDGTSITGATNAILTITNFQSVNSGNYSVAVTDAFGSVTSSNALVSTSTSIAPMILGQPKSKSVPAGVTVTFSVTAAGASPLNYYWSFNNANIPGATNSMLNLTNVMLSQAGNYSVFIINAHGSTNSASAALSIIKNLPVLARVPSFGTMSISWSTNSAGFVLVTTTNLESGNWVPVMSSPVQEDGQYFEVFSLTGTEAFYRLQFMGN